MREFVYNNIEHVLCVLVLIGRLGDVISTYLATPSLKLESNPIARKLRWPFILLTILACGIPYLSVEVGVVVLVVSFWVTAENVGRLWAIRAIGETDYAEFLQRAARHSTLSRALLTIYVRAFFFVSLGVILCILSPGPAQGLAFWFGIGIVTCGIATAWMGTSHFIRLYKSAKPLKEDPR